MWVIKKNTFVFCAEYVTENKKIFVSVSPSYVELYAQGFSEYYDVDIDKPYYNYVLKGLEMPDFNSIIAAKIKQINTDNGLNIEPINHDLNSIFNEIRDKVKAIS